MQLSRLFFTVGCLPWGYAIMHRQWHGGLQTSSAELVIWVSWVPFVPLGVLVGCHGTFFTTSSLQLQTQLKAEQEYFRAEKTNLETGSDLYGVTGGVVTSIWVPSGEQNIVPRHNDPLLLHQGPVSIKVQVPNMQDKTEWKLNGQVLVFTLPLTDQVMVAATSVIIGRGTKGSRDKFPPTGLSKGPMTFWPP